MQFFPFRSHVKLANANQGQHTHGKTGIQINLMGTYIVH